MADSFPEPILTFGGYNPDYTHIGVLSPDYMKLLPSEKRH